MIGNNALSWAADFNAEIAECKRLLKDCEKFNIKEVNAREDELKLGKEIWELLAPVGEKEAFGELAAVKKEEKQIREMKPKILGLEETLQRRAVSPEYCQMIVKVSEDTGNLRALLNYAESDKVGSKRAAYFAVYACEGLTYAQKVKLLDKAALFEGREKITLRRADVRKAHVGSLREERLNQSIINFREQCYLEAKSYYEQSQQGKTKGYAKAELRELERWHREWSDSPNAVVSPTVQRGAVQAEGTLLEKVVNYYTSYTPKRLKLFIVVFVVFLCLRCVGGLLVNFGNSLIEEKYVSTTYVDGSKSKAKYTVENGVLVGITEIEGTKLAVPTEIDGQKITEIRVRLEDDTIEAISIPEGVVYIGDSFRFMDGLREIILPSTLKTIDEYTFKDSNNLETIVFAENSQLESVAKDVLANTIWYSKQIMEHGYVLAGNLLLKRDTLVEEVYIPEGTTAINAAVFYGDKGVTSITIPASVKKIGNNAFEASGLTSVVFEGDIECIGERVFAETSDLKTVTFKGKVKEIGVGAFYKCFSLVDFKLPEGIEKIGGAAFGYCDGLNNIVIPEGVKEIGDEAFGVHYLNTPIVQETLVIPESVEKIGENAFIGHRFENVEVKGSIKEIGANGLGEVGNMQEENGMCTVGNILLAYTGEDKNVVIPEGITCIVGRTFAIKGILTVSIPEGVTVIAPGTFERCGALQRVSLPESLEVIGADAFKSCDSLPFITIPEKVTTIGNQAFAHCGKLNLIEGGDGLVEVARDAFQDAKVPPDLQEKLNKLWGIVEEEE